MIFDLLYHVTHEIINRRKKKQELGIKINTAYRTQLFLIYTAIFRL